MCIENDKSECYYNVVNEDFDIDEGEINIKTHFDFNDLETMRLINQSGVTQFVYEGPSKYNACWDSILFEQEKVYFALCTELTTSEYTKLVEYDYLNNSVRDIFSAEEMILPNDRYIRDSKLHTSLSVTRDNQLIMTTHTTDSAPAHPAWMPYGNYSNPWEGFVGSSLLVFDPKTDMVENHGILVHRETLYGGMYDEVNHYYYSIGFIKGHLYRYDISKRKVEDLGKVTERSSYRFVKDLDKNLYFTSRNGRIMKIDVHNNEVIDTQLTLPNASFKNRNHAYMTAAELLSDGRILMTGMHDDRLSIYNPSNNTLETLGRYVQFDRIIEEYESTFYIGGMKVDKNGVLWYVVCGTRLDNNEDFITASSLYRWDFNNKKEPEYLGVVGTESRVSVRTCEVHYSQKNHMLIVVGTNHANDGIEITNISLEEFEQHSDTRGPIPKDPLVFPNSKEYKAFGQSIVDHWNIVSDNNYNFEGDIIPIAIHKILGRNIDIKAISFEKGELFIDTGEVYKCILEEDYPSLEKVEKAPLLKNSYQELEESITLNHYNGRQYRGVSDKSIQLSGAKYLVSSLDGMFAIYDGESVFNLGTIGVYAPVLGMVKANDGSVYGIMGDKDDLNILFKFSLKTGFETLGIMAYESPLLGAHNTMCLKDIAYDPIKNRLAISSDDALSSIYIIQLGEKNEY